MNSMDLISFDIEDVKERRHLVETVYTRACSSCGFRHKGRDGCGSTETVCIKTRRSANGIVFCEACLVAALECIETIHLDDREFKKYRKVLSVQLRGRVWLRDKGYCQKCSSRENIHIDHIRPLAKGGTNDIGNLRLLCKHCNLSKRDVMPLISG